ncbi:hypothetical protein MMC29_003934 [Sticta canariensis]|nr:hypothetical protein [Sticta canariensis]
MTPSHTKQWTVHGKNGFDSLRWNEKAEIPRLGDNDVLVHFYYASPSYRELCIPLGKHPFPTRDGHVPGTDGAGVVEAVGSKVSRFKPGDKVITLFNQGHLGGYIDDQIVATGLGGSVDGTFRQYGAFNEHGLVAMPSTLNFQQASTLPCAALTAWNALYGLEGRALKAGDTVLTQGTGGVSVFALQFAKAAGARVIATTSSTEKAEILKRLGADHVLDYKKDPKWGESARALTPDQSGVQHIIEVGGPNTMAQSFVAIKREGVISVIGFMGGLSKGEPSFLETLNTSSILRGIMVGSRVQLEELTRAIDANLIKPVVDEKVFALEELKECYQYMGNLTVKIDSPD